MEIIEGQHYYSRQEIARAFALTLRAARDKRGLSQETLSKICGVNRTYTWRLEHGLSSPSVAILLRLSSALKDRPEQFLTDMMARLAAAEGSASKEWRDEHERRY